LPQRFHFSEAEESEVAYLFIFQQIGDVIGYAEKKVFTGAYRLDIDVQGSCQPLLRNAALQRPHDQVMLLDGCEPVALVVGKSLVIIRHNATSMLRIGAPQSLEPHMTIEKEITAVLLTRHR
jgi:hypothetical protein